MGERPGTNALRFEANGIDPLLVEVPSGPGPATRLQVRGEEPAPARVASTLTDLPRLRLVDEFDNPIHGATIRFTLPQGGAVAAPEAVTDAAREVQVPDWTLGPRKGGQLLSALYSVEVRAPVEAGLERDSAVCAGRDPAPIAVHHCRVDELPQGLDSPEALVRFAAPGVGGEDRLEWDPKVFPMVTVWDLDTGAMVGMIRGGTLRTDLRDGEHVRFRFEDGLRSFDFREGALDPVR